MSVSFTCPRVGPHQYVVTAGSGWAEMFDRKSADAALMAMLEGRPVPVLVDGFLLRMRGDVTTWESVVEYLIELTHRHDLDLDTFPAPIAVAFWGYIATEQKRRRDAKK